MWSSFNSLSHLRQDDRNFIIISYITHRVVLSKQFLTANCVNTDNSCRSKGVRDPISGECVKDPAITKSNNINKLFCYEKVKLLDWINFSVTDPTTRDTLYWYKSMMNDAESGWVSFIPDVAFLGQTLISKLESKNLIKDVYMVFETRIHTAITILFSWRNNVFENILVAKNGSKEFELNDLDRPYITLLEIVKWLKDRVYSPRLVEQTMKRVITSLSECISHHDINSTLPDASLPLITRREINDRLLYYYVADIPNTPLASSFSFLEYPLDNEPEKADVKVQAQGTSIFLSQITKENESNMTNGEWGDYIDLLLAQQYERTFVR